LFSVSLVHGILRCPAVSTHALLPCYKTSIFYILPQFTLTDPPEQQLLHAMYRPLTSSITIRVLHVYPAPEADPLTCSLEHCDLDNDPEYEALSYVWGNSDLPFSITCDSRVVAVTCNLYQALLRVRLPDRRRTVWIDGLCINQIDDVEKSHQVQLMQRVFRNAHRVLVWLGPDPHGQARHAFDVCVKLGQRDLNAEELEATLTRTDLFVSSYSERWDSIHALSLIPWWGRVWIIQEFALAKDLLFMWGAEESQWTHINLAISNLSKPGVMWRFVGHYSKILEPMTRLSMIKERRYHAETFMGTIHMARGFKCSDNRDRIYGILGLGAGDDRWAGADPVGESLAKATIPDYALPIEHVYGQFAVLALQHNLIEDIFLAIQHGEQLEQWQPGDMPSWSPRWDLPLVNSFPLRHRLFSVCEFDSLFVENGISFTRSIPERTSALQSNFNPLTVDTLNVFSATLDKIIALSDYMPPFACKIPGSSLESFWEEHIRPKEAADGYKALMTDLCETATFHMTSENHVVAFYAASQDMGERSPEAIANYAKHGKNAMLRSIAQLLSEASSIASIQKEPTLDPEKEGHDYFKRFYLTQQGYVGMCPAAARPGDLVALLWNTACPMILRPQHDFYRIIGSSYMPALDREKEEGVSHPLDDLMSGGVQPEMIQIR